MLGELTVTFEVRLQKMHKRGTDVLTAYCRCGRALAWTAIVAALLYCILAQPACLQAGDDNVKKSLTAVDDSFFEISDPRTYRLRLSFRVEAPGKPLKNVIVTGPVPIDWREQRVKLLEEHKPPGTTTRITQFPGQAAMLVVRFAPVPAGGYAEVVRVYELTRYQVRFRGDPQSLRVPQKPSRQLRKFLGPAPGVEVDKSSIRGLAKSLSKPDAGAWQNVRGFYDWIRRHVKYQTMNFRGAEFTVKTKTGDCEDMTALFVALCRAGGIPARTVWIEGHAYPEFYLEDNKGRGFWIPAQVSGPAWFGRMAEYGPILQKTDRLRDPIRRRYVRYVPQTARATGGVPRLRVTRTILPGDSPSSEPRDRPARP